jgi:hypothetical protein
VGVDGREAVEIGLCRLKLAARLGGVDEAHGDHLSDVLYVLTVTTLNL